MSQFLKKLKNSIKLKHIAIIGLAFFVIAFSYQSYRLSVKRNELRRSKEQYDVQTALLRDEIKHKMDSINLLDIQKQDMQIRSDSLNKIIASLMRDRWILKVKLKEALAEVDSATADDNYWYLQNFAYPDTGKLKFPFSSNQVGDIRKDYIRVDGLEGINVNLEANVFKLEKQVGIKDSIIVNQGGQIQLYKNINSDCQELVSIKSDEIKGLSKDINKEKRRKFLWKSTTFGAIVYILISLL